MSEQLSQTIEQFFADEHYAVVKEIQLNRSYVVDGGPRGQRLLVKIDPIEAERRPGKPKGKGRGKSMVENARMEEIFKLMKDYRFFKLCLPAVFGMGRYREAFDWVLLKYYDGDEYQWSEKDSAPDALGGKAISVDSASEIAIMVFDLTQVPVLKFSKKVETTNYKDEFAALKKRMTTDGIKTIPASQQEIESAVQLLEQFVQKEVPTLFTIQNGDFYPRNFLHLEESILLLDWEDARISAVEELIAYISLLMWGNEKWIERFHVELNHLVEMNTEWLTSMMLYRSLLQLEFWSSAQVDKEELHTAREALYTLFQHSLQQSQDM